MDLKSWSKYQNKSCFPLDDTSSLIWFTVLALKFQLKVFIQRRYRSVRNFSAILPSNTSFSSRSVSLILINWKLSCNSWLHAHWFISICSLAWILLRILSCLSVQWKYFSFISCRNTEYSWAWHPLLQRFSAFPFQCLDISLALGKILRLS